MSLLDGDEAREMAPYLGDAVIAALYCPDEGHSNPRLLTTAFARRAAASGATILTSAAVSDISRNGGMWRIRVQSGGSPGEEAETPVKTVRCKQVLNAAGTAAPTIAAMANLHLPLFTVGLTMNATEKVPALVPHLVQHVGRKLSLKQTDDGNLLIGGGWSAQLRQQRGQWSDSGAPRLRIESLLGNLRAAADIVPQVKQLRLIRTWTGSTCITADQLPVLGEVPQAPGFHVAAGGSGFTYGPTYARLMSELMLTGKPSYSLQPFSPARFDGLNAFMG